MSQMQKVTLSQSPYSGAWSMKKWDDKLSLSLLALIFEEGSHYLDWFLRELSDSLSRGYGGNLVDIDFDDNQVTIMFAYDDNPEEYTFVINKELLIQIIKAWQKLVNQEPKEITCYQDGDVYTLEGVLENGEKVTDTVS